MKQYQNARFKQKEKRNKMIVYHELVNWSWRSQKKVVEAPPAAHLFKFISKGPVVQMLQHLRLNGVDDKDNPIIVKIAMYE